MSEVYYSTWNGQRDGRAGYFHRAKANAEAKVAEQNASAETQGLKVRYSVASCAADGLEAKDIRD